MGLFDYFKKKTIYRIDVNGTDDGTTSIFKGDLAAVQEEPKEILRSADTKPAQELQPVHSDAGDSTDSVVFLSFYGITKAAWYCPECGTACDGFHNGCLVCGFKV